MSCPMAVAVAGGGGVIHNPQQYQDDEDGVDKRQDLVSQVTEVQRVPEDCRASLNDQQKSRYQREPELLVYDTYFPVDVHFESFFLEIRITMCYTLLKYRYRKAAQ